MIVYLVRFSKLCRPIYLNKSSRVVFTYLTSKGISTESAIDADSWSELAAVGEEYETEEYAIQVIET